MDKPNDDGKSERDDRDDAHDRMLLNEGLALLASYKKIKDPALRASLLRLVRLLGASPCDA